VENFRGLIPGGATSVRATTHVPASLLRHPTPLSACSACSGNYEDPERTARGPDADEAAAGGEPWPDVDVAEESEVDEKTSEDDRPERAPRRAAEEL